MLDPNAVNGFTSGYQFGDIITGQGAVRAQAAANLALQKDAQEYNSAEAQKDRDFQERMSNTSYQRAMKDLSDAGVNPLLAVQGLSGSSTPSGSSASISQSSASKGDSVLGNLVKVAGSAALFAKVMKILSKFA